MASVNPAPLRLSAVGRWSTLYRYRLSSWRLRCVRETSLCRSLSRMNQVGWLTGSSSGCIHQSECWSSGTFVRPTPRISRSSSVGHPCSNSVGRIAPGASTRPTIRTARGSILVDPVKSPAAVTSDRNSVMPEWSGTSRITPVDIGRPSARRLAALTSWVDWRSFGSVTVDPPPCVFASTLMKGDGRTNRPNGPARSRHTR